MSLLKQHHLLLLLTEMSQSHDLCGQKMSEDVTIVSFSYLDCCHNNRHRPALKI